MECEQITFNDSNQDHTICGYLSVAMIEPYFFLCNFDDILSYKIPM